VKEDGELLACHATEQDAIDQMVAVSISEDMEPGGTYEGTFRAAIGSVNVGDFVSWLEDEDDLEYGRVVWATDLEAEVVKYEDEEGSWYETEEKEIMPVSDLTVVDGLPGPMLDEQRQINLEPPTYMQAAAVRGLQYYSEGLAGDGVTDQTIREARAMARGEVSADKWVRIAAWIARHMPDLDAPAADPDSDDYPSPGVVAHLLWGSGPSKEAAERALTYAEGVVGRIREEEDSREAGVMRKVETRVNATKFEVRETPDGMEFEGYASVFNSRSENLGGFTEFVAPGAFTRSLKSRNDVKLLWNHDSGAVLGSTRAKSMTLTEDERGLKVRATLPNTQLGRDTAELIRTGIIDSMSFGFNVIKDSWNAEGNERTLHQVRLFEVSIVAFPAYAGTAGTTSVRSIEKLAKRAEVDMAELEAALIKLESGEDLDEASRDLLNTVINKVSPEKFEPEGDDSVLKNMGLLALKKKKLDLLDLQ
jgi:HK97 family phage prohead protease